MKKQKGFSLIELMIVVAVIGALTAIAIPQYQKFTEKSEITAAVASLSALKTLVETAVTEKGAFPADDAALKALGATQFNAKDFKVDSPVDKAGNIAVTTTSSFNVAIKRDAAGIWSCTHSGAGIDVSGCTIDATTPAGN